MVSEIPTPQNKVKSVAEEAEKEVQQELIDAAKRKIKSKLKEIAAAENVLRNLKRELEDLYVEIGEQLS